LGGIMDFITKINLSATEFNSLIVKRNNAEKWFDEPTTTEIDRQKWYPKILQLNKDIDQKGKELESLGFTMRDKFYWYGIPG
jgi:hypothetical protein